MIVWRYLIFGLVLIAPPALAHLRISEIASMGTPTFTDFEDEASDWIEIENPGGQAVNLSGWSLSDDENRARKWMFTEGSLSPGQRLVVFASNRNGVFGSPPELHTNFRLSRNGETVLLTPPNGSSFETSKVVFPEIRRGYTYGIPPNRSGYFYLDTPTPGAPNQTREILQSILGDLSLSPDPGFYSGPLTLTFTPPDGVSRIYYTLDGSLPSPTGGRLYTGPIEATQTLQIRAAAFRTGYIPSPLVTATYWLGAPDWMATLPVLSLVMTPDDLHGEAGIRGFDSEGKPNAVKDGRAWERPVAVQFIDPASPERKFSLDAGIRMHGNDSVRVSGKPSFRLYFREEYGRDSLEFPLIPDSSFQSFDALVLRGGHQDPTNPFIQDELARRIFSDMGQASSLGTFAHVFLNGSYYGYYNPVERFDGDYFRQRYGVDSNWDIIRNGVLGEGSSAPFEELFEIIRTQPVEEASVYREVTKRLDVVNFIDYLLLNLYGSTWDWPGNNVTISHEAVTGGKIRYHVWDAEGSFGLRSGVTTDTIQAVLLVGSTNESRLFMALRRNADFRRLFAARVRKHFYEDGALTDTHILRRFLWLRQQVLPAIPNFVPTVSFGWAPLRRHYLMTHLHQHGMLEEIDQPVLGDPAPTDPPSRVTAPSPSSPDQNFDGQVDAKDLEQMLGVHKMDRKTGSFGIELGSQDGWRTLSFPVGEGVRDLRMVNLGSGRPDLVAVNANYGCMLRLPNLGGGRFGEPEFIEAGLGASALAVGDFNRDGLPDVVTGNDGMMGQSISVLLNQGSGRLRKSGEVELLSIGENPYLHLRQLLTADFDRDGNTDLLVCFHSSYVGQSNAACILFGDGAGGFSDRNLASMGATRLYGATLAAVEDWQGTGSVAPILLDGDSSCFLWRPLAGRQFSPPERLGALGSLGPLTLDAADMDGDSFPDLVIADGPLGTVRVLYNSGTVGFSPTDSTRISADRPSQVKAADLNQDGRMDLVVCNSNPALRPRSTVRIYWNRGGRTFEASDPLELGGEYSFPNWVTVGDVDGSDGADFAVSDEFLGRITLFLNFTEGNQNSADFNGDGVMDLMDLAIFSQEWKKNTAPSRRQEGNPDL